jgi:hypothetical protein
VASVTALKTTFARIAQLMDPEEDILFLYLTSHGSKEHRFTLDFWPLQFNPLDPAVLRKLLDDSGIKRRVVVVSACYSGGFIEPLRSADTLVITAASSERTSFGCGNENDFTYFGKTYFDEALRKTYSFVEAFERARPKIAAREKAQHFESSEPQMAIGEGIKPALAALEARLAHPTVAAAPASPPDKYARFADLWLGPESLQQVRRECQRGIEQVSPAANVARYPDYYGGIDRRSPLWPRIVAAWNAYVDEYCAATSDERVYRRAYAELWSRDLAERDLDAAEKFLATESGRRFLGAANDVSAGAARKVLEASAGRAEAAVRHYRDELARIGAEFRRGEKGLAKE